MTVENMWQLFCRKNGVAEDTPYDAWSFGDVPDKLLSFVLQGMKTATSSACELYQLDEEPIAEVGEYNILLDSKDNAQCVIRTTRVEVLPFDAVTAEMAAKEGEGDLSLEYWRKVHTEFFTDELSDAGLQFTPKTPVVYEEFEVVYSPFTVHDMTDDEAREVCSWQYEMPYQVYNTLSYDESKQAGKVIADSEKRQGCYYSVYRDGELFGSYSVRQKDDGIELGLAVKPECCGMGNGHLMINLALTQAIHQFPDDDIFLMVLTWNERAIRCYTQAEFAVVETVTPENAPNPEPMYRMKYRV